eukprot:c12886_g1_i1 orf=181-900(+)
MSNAGDESVIAAVLNAVLEKNPSPSSGFHASPRRRFFGRERTSVHALLGGGLFADVLLWRKKHVSAGFLIGATVIWVLFEWAECHLLTLISVAMLIILVSLFAWSNAAAFLHRSLPPLPEVEISDELLLEAAKPLRKGINNTSAILHDMATGKDMRLFLKVALGLWLLSIIGGWFHFLSILYFVIVVAHTIPVIYERNQNVIDKFSQKALDKLYKFYKKIDAAFLSKIPRGPTKQKKAQ